MKKAMGIALAAWLLSACKPDVLGEWKMDGNSPWCSTEHDKVLQCRFFSEKHCERSHVVNGTYGAMTVCVLNPTL